MASMYAVQLAFSDDPARLDHRPAHRERLAGLVDEGTAAGGRTVDATSPARCWSSWSTTATSVDAILAADPYYTAPGVTVAGVHEWNPVIRHPAVAAL